MNEQELSWFPRALGRFLINETGSGYTLLVYGAPGTGKTLLTLRCLDLISANNEVLYASTRVGQETVNEMYLREQLSLDKSDIVDLSQGASSSTAASSVPFDNLTMESLIEWIESVHSVAGGLTVAFDCWDLIHNYLTANQDRSPDLTNITTRLAELARKEGLDVILVSEDPDPVSLQYIADGVVSPQVTEDDRGRTCRHLQIEKLRGIQIDTRLQPFTLINGRFQALPQADSIAAPSSSNHKTWEPQPHSKQTFSTGIHNLDNILNSGYERGTAVHLELGADLPQDAWSILVLPTIRNFVAKEMNTTVVPPRETSSGIVQNDLIRVVDKSWLEQYVYVMRAAADDTVQSLNHPQSGQPVNSPDSHGPDQPHSTGVAPTEQVDPSADKHREILDSHRSQPATPASVLTNKLSYEEYIQHAEQVREQDEGPQLHVISIDNIQQRFIKELGALVNYAALHNDLMIFITKAGETLREQTTRVSNTHLRLERHANSIVLYGENPLTPRLGLDVRESSQTTKIKLLEVV